MPHPERRAWPRIRKIVRVQILDPAEVVQHARPGWIVDRSHGGICLCFHRSDVEVGDLLLVKPASTSGLSWVEVKVRNRRRKANRMELGCQFVRPPKKVG